MYSQTKGRCFVRISDETIVQRRTRTGETSDMAYHLSRDRNKKCKHEQIARSCLERNKGEDAVTS